MRPLYTGAADYAAGLAALRARGLEPNAFLRRNEMHIPGTFDVDCLISCVRAEPDGGL